MATATGIELGPDSALLVGVRTGGKGSEVTAVHGVPPDEWSSHDVAVTEKLQAIRRQERFPRAARVVAWGLPDKANAADPIVQAALRPLTAAGFRVDAVLSPAEALARLAMSRRRTSENAIAWVAINTFGAAIAIVRGRDLLFSRAFEWSFRPHPQPGARSELLQRYSLVAHLAPELLRGMAMVREAHAVAVDTVVTCGDLPDLRSLTMPLIEELDLEVETLDSADGLRAGRGVSQERLAERAPALRVAYAAATSPGRPSRPVPVLAAAAALLLLSLLGLAAAGYWSAPRSKQPDTTAASARTAPRQPTDPAAPPRPPSTRELPPQDRAAPAERSAPATTPVPPQTSSSAPRPGSQSPRVEPPAGPAVVPLDQVARNRDDNRVIPRPQGTQGVRSQVPAPTSARPKAAAPLKAPVPVVESILIDASRRLAVIEGQVVGVGDVVGSRTVAQIERDFVVFTEPSGHAVRARLRR